MNIPRYKIIQHGCVKYSGTSLVDSVYAFYVKCKGDANAYVFTEHNVGLLNEAEFRYYAEHTVVYPI